jgi:hypothetical protein
MTSPFPSVESTDPQIGRLSLIYGRGLFEMQAGTQPAAKVYCAKQLTEPEIYIGAPVNDQIRPEVYDNYAFYNAGADRLYGVFNWEDTDFDRGYKVEVVAVNPRTKAIATTVDLTSFYGITPPDNVTVGISRVTETRVWVVNQFGAGDDYLLGLNASTLATEVSINLTAGGLAGAFILDDTYFISGVDIIEITGLNTYNTYAGAATTFIGYSFIGYMPSINEYWCTFNSSFTEPNSSTDIGGNLIVRFTMTSPGTFSAPTFDVSDGGIEYIRINSAQNITVHPTEDRILLGFFRQNHSGAVEISVSATPALIASYGFNNIANPGNSFMYSRFNYFSDTTVIAAFQGLTNDDYQENGGDGNYRVALFERDITSQVPERTYACGPWGTQLATTSFVLPRAMTDDGVYVPNMVTGQTPTRNTTPPSSTPISLGNNSFLSNEFTIPVNEVVWFSIVLDGTFSLKITPALPTSLTPAPSQDPNYYDGMTPEYWCTIVAYNSVGEVVGFNGSYQQQAVAVAYDTGHWPLSLESTYPAGTYYIAVSGAGIYFENNTYCDQEFSFTAAGVYGDTIMRLRFMKYSPAPE